MTTTDLIRDRAFAPLASDLPADLTIAEYRRWRTIPSWRRRAGRALLLRWRNR
jgi:hypothetical protein